MLRRTSKHCLGMSCREEDLRVWSGLLPVPGEGPQLCLLFLVFCCFLCLGKSAAVPSWAPVRLTGTGLSGGVARPLGGGRVSREASGPTAKLFSWRPLYRLPRGHPPGGSQPLLRLSGLARKKGWWSWGQGCSVIQINIFLLETRPWRG